MKCPEYHCGKGGRDGGYLGGGGNDVGLVHASQRHAVHLEGTGHYKQAAGQLLKEHHTAALEAPSQQDEHSAWCDAGTKLGRLLHIAALQRLRNVLR